MAETEIRFASINDACRITGFSRYFIRNGCKDGSIPHKRTSAGQRSKYYVDLVAWRRQLDEEEEAARQAAAFRRAKGR